MIRRPPRSTLFPSTTLSRSDTFYRATPLTWAASPAMGRKPHHAEIVGLLLKHGAQGQGDALIAAVSAPDAAMTKIIDRKSTRLNSSHGYISYAVFCLKKKKT